MHIVSRRKMTRFNWATQVLTWGSQAAQKLEPFVECAGEVPVVREPGTCICPWLKAIPIQPMYVFTHWLVIHIDDLSRIYYDTINDLNHLSTTLFKTELTCVKRIQKVARV